MNASSISAQILQQKGVSSNDTISEIWIRCPTTGDYTDAHVLSQLAAEAEAAGWNGLSKGKRTLSFVLP
jgi:hypothetical protein